MKKNVDFQVEQAKSVLNVPEARKLLEQYSLKRVVEGRGHDGGGFICDLYRKSTKILAYNDDGWGGDAEIRFENDNKRDQLHQELKDLDFGRVMYENGWGFMDNAEKINIYFQVEHFINALNELRSELKIQKKCKARFVFGTKYRYREIYWKGVKNLSEINVLQLQVTYNKHKKGLKKGEFFFNTDEQLKSLGIKP